MRRLVVLFGFVVITATTFVATPASARTYTTVSFGESIQAAVDSAHPDDVITVEPGEYAESVSITKDNITLIGDGVTLTPGEGECGICVTGHFDSDGNLQGRVANVRIEGFSVEGFEYGVLGSGVDHLYVSGVTATSNDVAGIQLQQSLNSTLVDNTTTGSYYGIISADSQDANITVQGNEASGNAYGIFLIDTRFGWISENFAQDNCFGMLVIDFDAAGPSGSLDIHDNVLRGNTNSCDDPGAGFTVSGTGLAIVGSDNNRVHSNLIAGNVPSVVNPAAGGIVLLDGSPWGSDAPTNNELRENVVFENEPFDLVLDQGLSTILQDNVCGTSSTGIGC